MYLVDSNVLIEAKNRYYAFDIAPGFWAWLDHAHRHSIACSIVNVREELISGEDELAEWAKGHAGFFHEIDGPAVAHFPQLAAWATTRNYTQGAIDTFTGDAADFYLIAYAKAHGHTLVTHEQPSPESKKRIMIPDACIAMGVSYTDTFSMMRGVNARLCLEAPPPAPE